MVSRVKIARIVERAQKIESEIRGQSNSRFYGEYFIFSRGEFLAGSEFMVIQRYKKIGQTSGLIFGEAYPR